MVFEFVQLTYCIERYFSRALPSLASFVQDYLTTVTLAPLQGQKMCAGCETGERWQSVLLLVGIDEF